MNDQVRHVRPVKWLRPDVPRTSFEQDLLYSFGAFMTVCNISRNDAVRRVAAVLDGKTDSGYPSTADRPTSLQNGEAEPPPDLSQMAHDQIVARIQSRFSGHAMADLVDAVLRADGWVTRVSPPGPDGGVDILAGRGSLGLDPPRLCVQVKSQNTPADVTVYRTLQGTMQTFKAEHGLLVCWGGFNKMVLNESRQSHFAVRLWNSADLVDAMTREFGTANSRLRVDGGAAENNFLMQFQADILGMDVERPQQIESTGLGAAFLAGLTCGVWGRVEELQSSRKVDRVFSSNMSDAERREKLAVWKDAVRRVMI